MQIQTEGNNTIVTISKRALKALVGHAADASRINLNVVRYDPQAGMLAATDGHRMLRATTRGVFSERGVAVSLCLDGLQALLRAAKVKDSIVITVSTDGATATAAIGAASFVLSISENPFPPLDQVCPKDRSNNDNDATNAIGIDATLLADVKLFAPKTVTSTIILRLPTKPLAPIVVTATDIDECIDWYCVIMPVRF